MAKQNKSTRLIYNDEAHIKMFENMPAEDFKELMMQMLTYKYGDTTEPHFSNPMTTAVWMMIKKEIDFNEEKWAKRAQTSRENGAKSKGRPLKVELENWDNFVVPEDFDIEFANEVKL